MLFGVGGMLQGISGHSYGWHIVGVAVVAHMFNRVSLVIYFLK